MRVFLEYLPWLWFGSIIIGGSLVRLFWSGVVVLRAADVDYDPARCAARRPAVDLRLARTRRIIWPRLALPLFLICVALFATQLIWMSLVIYTLISIAWFLTTPLRNLWIIAVSRRVHAELPGQPRATGYWQDVRWHYSSGFAMPDPPADRTWFVGRFAG